MQLIDFHCDTISKIYKNNKELLKNNYSVDINKLLSSHSLAQFFAIFIQKNKTTTPLKSCLNMIDKFYSELKKNKDTIALARNYDDLLQNKKGNKISAFLTIEEGACLEGDLNNLRNLNRLGVKLLTLTWNFPNELGYPSFSYEYMKKGLTPFGIEVVKEMNNLNMIIDVSHLSDKGFYDVLNNSSSPFVASHSNSRTITNNPRNLTDDMISSLANKGGLIGINFCGKFLCYNDCSKIEDMIRHIKHIKNIGGIDVISLGSDFDGINSKLEIENIGQINKLLIALEKHNFSYDEIEKIFYKNAIRLLKDIG